MCCCIGKNDEGKYTCCCGCSLFCGVIIIFILEVLSLITAIQFFDLIGIIVSGILTGMFLIACCKRDSSSVRFNLFVIYLFRAIIFAVTMVYYLITQNATDLMTKICNGMNKGLDWPDCQDSIADVFWWLVGGYIVFILLFRLSLAHLLYYYYKEAKEVHHEDRRYSHLSDRQTRPINDDHHRNNQAMGGAVHDTGVGESGAHRMT